MLKALFKKQFLELNSMYFRSAKTGKNRGKVGTILFVLLFVLVFISLGVMFYGVGSLIGEALVSTGLGWLFFALMGMIALLFGVFGGVFNTYAGLFHAKDNELLLSMPIPPSRILLVRLVGVYAMGLLYESIVMIPSIVVWWGSAPNPTACDLILQIFLTLLLGFVVLALTCALGWVVALISAKLKNKSFATVLTSLVFIAAYYVVYFRINGFMMNVVQKMDSVAETVKSRLYPVYLFGMAGDGDVGSFLIFAGIAVAVCALCWVIMSRTFLKIATTSTGEKKAAYKEQPVKEASVRNALLRRELLHFKSSPTYMLNCGLGLILLPVAAVAALVKMNTIRDMLASLTAMEPLAEQFLPLIAAAGVGLLSSMNNLTSPSISLEGRSLWVIQSLPVDPWEALQAKINMHVYLSAVPTLFAAVVLCVVLRCEYSLSIFVVVISLLFTQLSALLGLALNLKHPNFKWTNETVAVKQNMTALILIFGMWALSAGMAVLYYPLRDMVTVSNYMVIWLVVLALANRGLMNWLKKTGSRVFAAL